MEEGKYDRRVTLRCPTCGSDQFEYDEDDQESPVTCANCGRQATREDLTQDNNAAIESQVAEMGDELIADAAKELQKSLRDAFRGNKNIRFK